MAEEQDKGQKTEKPTPRKIQEARKEGNYAKSMDVNSAAVLIFGILSLAFFGSNLLNHSVGNRRVYGMNDLGGVQPPVEAISDVLEPAGPPPGWLLVILGASPAAMG